MKDRIALFTELGRRLSPFGNDERTRAIIARACEENPWFTPHSICRAVRTIAHDMLQADKLTEWVSHYPICEGKPLCVLVVMAGNIPLVGFFDLLCVMMAGHECRIKPSAKDSVMMHYIVELIHDIAPAAPVGFATPQTVPQAVIATGSDEAKLYFESHYAGIPSLLRGSRQSVAVLDGHETEVQLAGLSDDIWAYSGLGCRNVSLLFLPEGYTPRLRMPEMNPKYRNNHLHTRALLTLTRRPFVDWGASTAIEQDDFPAALSSIALCRYTNLRQVEEWLAAHDAELQCVVSQCVEHSRRVDFGHAQSPQLTDYADDRDVMEFLAGLAQ